MPDHAFRAAHALLLALEAGWQLERVGPCRFVRTKHGHRHGVKSRTVLLVAIAGAVHLPAGEERAHA